MNKKKQLDLEIERKAVIQTLTCRAHLEVVARLNCKRSSFLREISALLWPRGFFFLGKRCGLYCSRHCIVGDIVVRPCRTIEGQWRLPSGTIKCPACIFIH